MPWTTWPAAITCWTDIPRHSSCTTNSWRFGSGCCPRTSPEILQSMDGVVGSYIRLNRHAEALRLCEETLALRQRVLSPDHPETLHSMGNLATCYNTLNRHADALRLQEETLTIMTRVQGRSHRVTLLCMDHLAWTYARLNRHADALTLHEEVLAVRKRRLPGDHPETLYSMERLADCLIELDRGPEALPILDDVIAKASTRPGENRRFILTALVTRGKLYQKTGDLAGCRATMETFEKLNPADADGLYNAACFRAITAGVQAKTPGADAAKLAQDDADRAMAWLTKAVAAGFKDHAHMEKDADLDALRGRADFHKLVASLPAWPRRRGNGSNRRSHPPAVGWTGCGRSATIAA